MAAGAEEQSPSLQQAAFVGAAAILPDLLQRVFSRRQPASRIVECRPVSANSIGCRCGTEPGGDVSRLRDLVGYRPAGGVR